MIARASTTFTPLDVSRAELEAIAARVGRSFFLLDLDRVRSNFEAVLAAFRRHHPDTALAYSVKSNYTPCILDLIRALGGLAEVVSSMEYEMAIAVGFEPDEIMINGPLHEDAFLAEMFAAGVRINLDSWYMLDTLDRVSRAAPERDFRVGLRLSYPIPESEWSRFGFEATPANLRRLAAWFEQRPNCHVVGLHSHFSFSEGSPESCRVRISGLVEAAAWFPGPLDYLDLGGGHAHGVEASIHDAAAAAVGRVLERAFPERRPTLFIEPGKAVVGDAMAFVSSVYDVRERSGRTLALINGSRHGFNAMNREHLTVRVLGDHAQGRGEDEHFTIMGNTCMERRDLICEVPGSIRVGDYVVVSGVGATSHNLKPPFIHTCPAMVARQAGRYAVVKRRETTQDVLRSYVLGADMHELDALREPNPKPNSE